ncbi:MAG: thioredoxin-disulfide reductase [Desulfobaccales bacterium]
MEKRELVILGAGPAGLTAAIYGKRAGLDVLLIEKGRPGGQINITNEIENFPGVIHATGQELAASFRAHAQHFKAEFREATIKALEIRNGRKVVVTTKGEVEAEAIIIATGARYKKVGCPGEAKFTGSGVSYCAVCDAAFFENEVVAVIGGGTAAVEEAVYLTNFASRVYIIHRRDAFRAHRIALERAFSNPKIVPVLDTVVESIEGKDLVEKLVLKNVKTGDISDLPVAGVFVFVGIEPTAEFARGVVDTHSGGWIATSQRLETSVEGIFAAGDVRDTFLRQVVTAAGDGASAAMAAYGYISEQLHLQSLLLEPIKVFALFTSSIDQGQVKLAGEAEKLRDQGATRLALIDGYRNARMVEKLGLTELPAMVELNSGRVVRCSVVRDAENIKVFCAM